MTRAPQYLITRHLRAYSVAGHPVDSVVVTLGASTLTCHPFSNPARRYRKPYTLLATVTVTQQGGSPLSGFLLKEPLSAILPIAGSLSISQLII